MGKIGIFYGSTEGNTEDVVEKVKDALGDADVFNVDSASSDDLGNYDNIIFGASTWEIGELQEDWETFIDVLDDADFATRCHKTFERGKLQIDETLWNGEYFIQQLADVDKLLQAIP